MKSTSRGHNIGARDGGVRSFQWLETTRGEFSKDWKWRGGLCAAVVAAAAPVFAQEGKSIEDLKKLSPEELMSVEVRTVTTVSKKSEKETDAPATVVVITASDIRLRGYSTLVDVLRDLPGMETIPYYFSEIGTQVPVRGIQGNNKIVVLVNGMRVNPPGGENFPFRSDFSVRDAERIEVVYGPGSTLYGQDAISAVINVITKKPSQQAGGEVLVAGGLNNEREAYGSFGGALDKDGHLKLSGYAQYHDSHLTRLDKEYPGWWKSFKELAAPRGDGVVPYRRDYGVNVFGRVDVFEESYVQAWFRDSYRNSSEGGYPPAFVNEARWEDSSVVVEGHNTHSFSDAVKLDSAAIYNHYEIDPDTRYVFNTPGLTNAWFLNDFKYGIGESYRLEETVRVQISDKLSLVGGAMAGRYNIVPKATIPGGAEPDADLVAQGGSFTYSTPADPGTLHEIPRVVRSKYEIYAGYAELAWQIADPLKLVAGARLTDDSRFSENPFTPRAALIYDITHELTAKYIYSRAYVQPAPYFANAVYDNGTLLATDNPDLKPEKSETHEINLSYNRKNLSLGASTYYGQQHDIITMSDQSKPQNIVEPTVYLDGDPSQPRTLVHTANSGDSTSWGFDFYGRATLGAVSPWFSYSYTEFEEDIASHTYDLTGASHQNGRLGATWAVTPKLYVTPAFVIRSTPEHVTPGELKHELDTPWQLDLYALYNLCKTVDLFANVRNLTDHHYALSGLIGQAAPQETLNGEVGIRATF
jgi:outer membrane receptor for ferrienterochelin and colicin